MIFRNVGSLSNYMLVNFSCPYVNWGQHKDQICLPEGQVSNFSTSAFRPITTKYDLIEAKRLECHPIAPFGQRILEFGIMS